MKKKGILNAQICRIVASLGHTDLLVIGDCGLPIPDGVERVDLALVRGVPRFAAVVEAVADELVVQRFCVAEEILNHNPEIFRFLKGLFNNLPMETVSHETFKSRIVHAKAVIRTGEATPYANVILECGVAF
jgi:D-ribose pyranase